jgi:hypothetical protein
MLETGERASVVPPFTLATRRHRTHRILVLALATVVLLLGVAVAAAMDLHRGPSDVTASSLCNGLAARTKGTLGAAAYPTTVRDVRDRRGGPSPGISPADKPWAELAPDARAPWCTIEIDGTYYIIAVTSGGPDVTFITSDSYLDSGPGGPAVP